MKKRRKIHSDVKILAALNALPDKYKKQIHRTQLKRYEELGMRSFFGSELSTDLKKEIKWIRDAGDFPKLKMGFQALLKLCVFFRSIVSKLKGFNGALKKEKRFFVTLFKRFKPVFTGQRFAKLIGIAEETFSKWKGEVETRCADSYINTCRKFHPNQLLRSEVLKIKALLLSDEFKHWPLSSIYYYALRNNIVSMSLSTWYKYTALIGVERLKPKSIKVYGKGIRATRPNELWHADVTYVQDKNNKTFYAYTVIDNYSRFPLAVEMHDKLCGKIRAESFRNASRFALEIDSSLENILLMTDGGSENFNVNVTDFLNSVSEIPIHHIRALKDGWRSNAMAEAFNRILKTYYINHEENKSEKILREVIDFSVFDLRYSKSMPLFNGLSTFEVFTGLRPEEISYKEQIKAARFIRVMKNRNHSCQLKCIP